MAEDDKPYYRGFDELAKKLFPNADLTSADGDSGQDPPDIVEELRRLRVDSQHYAGMVHHHFASAPVLRLDTRQQAEATGDRLHRDRVTERWPVDVHPELTARIEECRSILDAACPTTAYEITHPAILEFQVAPEDYPLLPTGYAFKGGVARKALARALQLNIHTFPVRDMDIVHLGSSRNELIDEELAKTYMQDDWIFAKKAAIETQPNCKAYFKTREFGINQVILSGGRVLCTALALCDLISGTIRATHNHLKRHRGVADSIVAAKAVRFFAEGNAEGRTMRLCEDTAKCRRQIRHFHLAIHFARALEQNDQVALAFLNECIARRLTRMRYDGTVDNAIQRFCKLARLEPSFFRPRDNSNGQN